MSEVNYWLKKVQRDTEAHRRDYGQRKPRKDWSDYVIWVSTVGIIAVCLVLCWQEWF